MYYGGSFIINILLLTENNRYPRLEYIPTINIKLEDGYNFEATDDAVKVEDHIIYNLKKK